MRLEPRPRPTMLHTLGYPAGAIAATVVFASLLVLVAGANPFNVFWLVIKGAAGSQFAFMETLTRATPLRRVGMPRACLQRRLIWPVRALCVREVAFRAHPIGLRRATYRIAG